MDHAHHGPQLDPQERTELVAAPLAKPLIVVGFVAVLAALVVSFLTPEGVRRFWFAYLLNFSYVLSLSLGALIFVMLQHLTRAGWSVAVRRPAEIMAANMPLLAVLFLPILGVTLSGSGSLYHWAVPISAADHDAHAQPPEGQGSHADAHGHDDAHDAGHGPGLDALTLHKRPFLNRPFFFVRCVIYFAVWIGLGWFFWRTSVRQDVEGDADLTLQMQKLSAPGLLLTGLTLTFASFDLLMSLDAHWFSTIFGVYYFSGAMVGFLALLAIVLMRLQGKGLLVRTVTAEHYHDVGKLLFAFTFFWAYIAFSQYMLIWYGNIPEETGWMVRRGLATQSPNAWSAVILLLLLGHFVLPFAGLMGRAAKRSKPVLAFWAVWLLVMHWIDLYWLVMPEVTTDHLPLVVEALCLVGMGSWFMAANQMRAMSCRLLAVQDPRLPETLAFTNT